MNTWRWLPLFFLLSTTGYSQTNQEREIRRLGLIHTIENSTDFELIFTDRGSRGTLAAQGRKQGIQSLITVVEQGVLTISQQAPENRLPKLPFFNAQLTVREPLKVVISCPDLKKYKTSGSGSTVLLGQRFQHLDIDSEGAGSIHISRCRMYSLEAKLKGSGQIVFEQSDTLDAKFHLEGDGQIHAHDLESKNSQAQIFGKGTITTWPRNFLDGKVIGEGKLQYRGIPTTINEETKLGGVIEKYFPEEKDDPGQ